MTTIIEGVEYSHYEDEIGGIIFIIIKRDAMVWMVSKGGMSEAVYSTEKQAIAHIKGYRSGYHSKGGKYERNKI